MDIDTDDIEDKSEEESEEESSVTGIIAGFLAVISGTITFKVVSNPDPTIRAAEEIIVVLVIIPVDTAVANPVSTAAALIVFVVTIVTVEHWLTAK